MKLSRRIFQRLEYQGGYFSIPNQAAVLTYLIQSLHLTRLEDHRSTINICETGFGSGHSPYLFQEAGNISQVIPFDKFDRPYFNYPFIDILMKPSALVIAANCKTVSIHIQI